MSKQTAPAVPGRRSQRRPVSRRLGAGIALGLGIALAVGGAPLAAQADTTHTVSGTIYDAYGQPMNWTYVWAYHPGGTVGGDFGSDFSLSGIVSGAVTLNAGDHFAGSQSDPDKIVLPLTVGSTDVSGLVLVHQSGTMPTPTNTASISIQGQLRVGQTLTLSEAPDYTDVPGVVGFNGDRHYYWSCGATRLDDSDAPSYTLTAADAGCEMGITVISHPTALVTPSAGGFGLVTYSATRPGAVAPGLELGQPTLARPGGSTVTLPRSSRIGILFNLTFTGTAPSASVSYEMETSAGVLPPTVVLDRNALIPARYLKRPMLQGSPVYPGAVGVQFDAVPGTTPGRYRVVVPVTQLRDGVGQATKSGSATLVLKANTAYSKAGTSAKRAARSSGGYAVSVVARGYQAGATVAVYDKRSGQPYRRVGSATLKASGSKASAVVAVSKKYVTKGGHRYYVKVGAAKFAPSYQLPSAAYAKR